ncbi:MAG: hypothetical protein JWN00_1306 [Actinomycetia bacterium]|nr:hypothetical protein [Actinomycetes bacterium]
MYYLPVRGPAYLLAWRERDDGWRVVAWVSWDGTGYRCKEALVIAEDVRRYADRIIGRCRVGRCHVHADLRTSPTHGIPATADEARSARGSWHG